MPDSEFGAARVDALFTKLEVGAPGAVLRELGELPEDAPPVLRTVRARALQEQGRHREAAGEFRLVLQQERDNPLARQFLVFSLFGTGEHREAGRLLQPPAGPVFPHSGFLLKFLETFWPLRFGTALGAPMEGCELPDTPEEKAEREAADLVHSPGPGTPSARRAAGRLQRKAVARFHAGDIRPAHRYFYWAHRLHPEDPMLAAHHGYLCLLTGHAGRALEVLEPVVEGSLEQFNKTRNASDLPVPDLLVAYAWSLHDLGHHDEALRVLAAVFPEGPDDYAAHFVAAVCWLMLGQRDAMRRNFDLSVSHYFIDTWEQIIRPFIARTADWLERGAPGYDPAANSTQPGEEDGSQET